MAPARRGFSLIELLIVLALVAIGTGVVTLALRDGNATRLEEEGARLAALLESARAEARAAGLAVHWLPGPGPATGGAMAEGGFRFVGLPRALALPTHWLQRGTEAQVLGAAAVVLGPDAILPPQRVLLRLEDRRLQVGTDGLGPFAVLGDGEPAGETREPAR